MIVRSFRPAHDAHPARARGARRRDRTKRPPWFACPPPTTTTPSTPIVIPAFRRCPASPRKARPPSSPRRRARRVAKAAVPVVRHANALRAITRQLSTHLARRATAREPDGRPRRDDANLSNIFLNVGRRDGVNPENLQKMLAESGRHPSVRDGQHPRSRSHHVRDREEGARRPRHPGARRPGHRRPHRRRRARARQGVGFSSRSSSARSRAGHCTAARHLHWIFPQSAAADERRSTSRPLLLLSELMLLG